jgi:hypothetical protein
VQQTELGIICMQIVPEHARVFVRLIQAVEKLVTFYSPPQAKNRFLHFKNMISLIKIDAFDIEIPFFSACGGRFLSQLYK